MAASVAGDSNGGELRARSIKDGLANGVLVEVPGEELVLGRIDLRSFNALRNGLVVVATSDLDIEGLGPELAVGDGAVVMDGRNLSAQHIVAGGDLAGDGDGVSVAVVIEDGISTPLASLAPRLSLSVASALGVRGQGDLVDLEKLKIGLVDLGAITVARGKPRRGPAVVRAVPALLALAAAALVVPVESDLGAGRGFGSIGRGSGVFVGDDVGLVDRITHHRGKAPSLRSLPSRGVLREGSIDVITTEARVGDTANLSALNSSVAGDLGNEAREENSSVEGLGHFDDV